MSEEDLLHWQNFTDEMKNTLYSVALYYLDNPQAFEGFCQRILDCVERENPKFQRDITDALASLNNPTTPPMTEEEFKAWLKGQETDE